MIIKKAAMFGLDARIKQLCHPVSSEATDKLAPKGRALANQLDSGSHLASTKKAAMFGLDARIALAIFGALSVISGAALYSAIQDAKVISVIADINEMGKAFEQYYLDTGAELDLYTTSSFDATQLISDNTTGWNGPYISYTEVASNGYGFIYPPYKDLIGMYLRIANNNNVWGSDDAGLNPAQLACDNPTQCYLWIQVYVPNEIADAIDIKIDGEVKEKEGNLKIYRHPDGTKSAVYYKYMPVNTHSDD